MQKLELNKNKLKEKQVMNAYINKITFICGNKGKSNGVAYVYKLIDIFFTRKFLRICSWAGGSRSEQEKIPSKAFKNIILLFFQFIKLANRNFTLKECESFLKNVIRNLTRRNESTNQRISTVKKRPKKLDYKVKSHSAMESENIEESEIN